MLVAIQPPPTAEAWPAFLDGLVDRLFDFFGEHPIHDLLAQQPHRHSDESGDWPFILSIHQRFREFLAAGVDVGAPTADLDVAPALVFDVLHDAWHLPYRTSGEKSGDRVRQETKRILRAALLR
jgi:hypothetical protein